MSKHRSKVKKKPSAKAPSITVPFRGLCTFIQRKDSYQVYLLTRAMVETALRKLEQEHDHDGADHAADHRPVLAVRIKDIFIDQASTNWVPDALAHDNKGEQIGIWHLEGKHLTFTKVSGTRPSWTDPERGKGIDLQARHENDGLTPKSHQTLVDEGAASVTLQGGAITSKPDRQFMELKKGGKKQSDSPREFATAITWNAGTLKTLVIHNGQGKQLKVREGASIAITNVAPVPESDALKHFAHYYCIYEHGCPKNKQLSIHHSEEKVFDCVPPTPGPKP